VTTRKAVDDFLRQRKLAVAGVSRSGKGFGHFVWRALRTQGYDALAVNPNCDRIGDQPCYHTMADLPPDVGGVLVVVPPAQTERVVREAAAQGIRRIWMQQGSASPEALAFCAEQGIEAVSGHCIMMFAQPAHIHKLHGWIWEKLGKLPA
jgi:uncharacterized protein